MSTETLPDYHAGVEFHSRASTQPAASPPVSMLDMQTVSCQQRARSQEQARGSKGCGSMSPLQRSMLVVIETYTDYRPSVREIAKAIGRSLDVTHGNLKLLRERGFVDWKDGFNRTLYITASGH